MLNRSKSDPQVCEVMQHYKSSQALAAHGRADRFQKANRVSAALVSAAPEIEVLDVVSAWWSGCIVDSDSAAGFRRCLYFDEGLLKINGMQRSDSSSACPGRMEANPERSSLTNCEVMLLRIGN